MKEGIKLILEKTVKAEETAARVASGALDVFSTPMLIAFMENTAFNLAQKQLEEGETTVGISVNIKHLKANLVGDILKCEALLTKTDGKKLFFNVKVTYKDEIVGEGEHIRYIVDEKKFIERIRG
ncbi:thioesterase family protein [uncultured Ilyobacter sp.]|uniref:thioesterase family protein n=1 Tax=uncultured Ilyobacter sp. TaxID=544433 RepID=UPI0029C7FF84|nr:thioesterase family protein [uncultured Ilyobacter sp.]